jgi:thiol-disulfide isomerase/thioredoxin
MDELFGDTLLTKDGKKTKTQIVLHDLKFVCVYFSGEWCPPCKDFTPDLIHAYKE